MHTRKKRFIRDQTYASILVGFIHSLGIKPKTRNSILEYGTLRTVIYEAFIPEFDAKRMDLSLIHI